MVASTQITKTEIFAFIAVQISFKLLSLKVLFISRKGNRNWLMLLSCHVRVSEAIYTL